MRETKLIESEEHWLAMRRQDVTSTDVAALFGLSPYATAFEIWHQKQDGQAVEFSDTERMAWGRRLESAIAEGVAEDQGWQVGPFKTYMRDPELRLGSSFDYCILDERNGDGILEIKNVDKFAFGRSWLEHEDGSIEAPEHIELQVQHQMEVAELGYAYIAALVGGNEIKLMRRERDRVIGAAIRAKVAEFWASIEANKPPAPDYERDYDRIVRASLEHIEDKTIEADDKLEALLAELKDIQDFRKTTEAKEKALKAQIIEAAGTASRIRASSGTLSCGFSKPNPGKLITDDMVGTYIGARSAYRVFRFTAKKD
jgi:putative phage-type endonuclease